MSTYSTTGKQNILNLFDTQTSLDLNTRNSFFATICGFEASQSNKGSFGVYLGYQSGTLVQFGNANTYVGFRSGARNISSGNSTYLGAYSGSYTVDGDNTFLGAYSGQYTTKTNKNVYVGVDVGKYVVGGQNTFMGFQNTAGDSFAFSSNNIGIGAFQNVYGVHNIALGYGAQVTACNSTAIGMNTNTASDNAIIIGNNITNTGCNVCILKNNHGACNWDNSNNNYTNINDILISQTLSDGTTQTTIAGDSIVFNVHGSNLTLQNLLQSINNISSTPSLSNSNSWLLLSSNVDLGGHGYDMYMSSNLTTLSNQVGGLTLGSNVHLGTSNAGLEITKDVITLSNQWGGIQITSNGIVFSPKVLFSNMTVNGNMTFCNTATLCNNSQIVFGGGGGGGNSSWSTMFPCSDCNLILPYVYSDSNLTSFISSIFVESHLYVQSNIYCNRTIYGKLLELTCGLRNNGFTQLMGDIMLGGTTLCNMNNLQVVGPGTFDFQQPVKMKDVYINGNLILGSNATLCNFSSSFTSFSVNPQSNLESSNIFADDIKIACTDSNFIETLVTNDPKLSIVDTSLAVNENMYVAKNLYCNREIYTKRLNISCGMVNYGITRFEGDVQFANSNIFIENDVNVYGKGTFRMGEFNSVAVRQNLTVTDLTVGGTLILGSNATLCNFASAILGFTMNPGTGSFSSCNIFASDTPIPCTDSNFVENLVNSDKHLSIMDTSLAVNENLYIAQNVYCNRELYTKKLSVSCGMVNYGVTRFEGDVQFANSNIYIENDVQVHGKGTFKFGEFNMLNANNLNLNQGLTASGSIKLVGSPYSNLWWTESLDYNAQHTAADLVFSSANGVKVYFSDNFSPGVLNFTGKHRCTFETKRTRKDLTGLIVSSCGRYMDLNNEESVKIDEAIPVVKLCDRERDPTVFGVVCNFEGKEDTRDYKIGNLKFVHQKDKKDQKVIVNAHGEGGIWVCDVGGPLKNGDLITSSIVPGLGMRQSDDVIRSYTVAKITCDCDFSMDSPVHSTIKCFHDGKSYRKAFVGCIYKI